MWDQIDRTRPDLFSKVVFEAKFNPAAGQGAFTAMQDAITFANWFNVLPPTATGTEIEKAFEESGTHWRSRPLKPASSCAR
ncbi:hypothetical protein BGZ81_007869 [Podila clonocystis]|nr:hypothetical protein BGZ81_007869 [Podila clonocystis]